jgi:hypothetical protein
VHNEAIAIPETVDCIRALTGLERDAGRSIEKTDRALGITKAFLPATTQPIPHLAGPDVRHPALERVVARHAELRDIGLKGAEEPEESSAARPASFD